MNQKRRVWPVVVIVILLLPVLYFLSFGPASLYLHSVYGSGSRIGEVVAWAYVPINWLSWKAPPRVQEVIQWYATLWTGDYLVFYMIPRPPGCNNVFEYGSVWRIHWE